MIGANVNFLLKKYGRKIGPDPASINSAMMGGILSNNASGMCCGVVCNSYHTVSRLRFVLPDGNTFDTGIQTDYTRFEKEQTNLYATINEMRGNLFGNAQLLEKIRRKYRMKNTVGYSLNALVDYEHPLEQVEIQMHGDLFRQFGQRQRFGRGHHLTAERQVRQRGKQRSCGDRRIVESQSRWRRRRREPSRRC